MNNAQWLYDQVPGPDDEDEGVHLSSAHALQIAGELTRGAEALGKLDTLHSVIDRLDTQNAELLADSNECRSRLNSCVPYLDALQRYSDAWFTLAVDYGMKASVAAGHAKHAQDAINALRGFVVETSFPIVDEAGTFTKKAWDELVASNKAATLDDGFGNMWIKCDRGDCGLHIVRPGKVQCETPGCQSWGKVLSESCAHCIRSYS